MKALKKTTRPPGVILIATVMFALAKPALVAHPNPVHALAVIRALVVLATANNKKPLLWGRL